MSSAKDHINQTKIAKKYLPLSQPLKYVPDTAWDKLLSDSQKKLYQEVINSTLIECSKAVEKHLSMLGKIPAKIKVEIDTLTKKLQVNKFNSVKVELAQIINEANNQVQALTERQNDIDELMQVNVQHQIESAVYQLQRSEATREINYISKKREILEKSAQIQSKLNEDLATLTGTVHFLDQALAEKEKQIRQMNYLVYTASARLLAYQQGILITLQAKIDIVMKLIKVKDIVKHKVKAKGKDKNKDIEKSTQVEHVKALKDELSRLFLNNKALMEKFKMQQEIIHFQINKVSTMRVKLQNRKVDLMVSNEYQKKINMDIADVQNKVSKLGVTDSKDNSKKQVDKLNFEISVVLLNIIKIEELIQEQLLNDKIQTLELELNNLEKQLYVFNNQQIQTLFIDHPIMDKQIINKQNMNKQIGLQTTKPNKAKTLPSVINKQNALVRKIEDFQYFLENKLEIENIYTRENEFTRFMNEIDSMYLKNLTSVQNLVDIGEIELAEKTMDSLMKSYEVAQKYFIFQESLLSMDATMVTKT